MKKVVRIGTRESQLAVWQATHVQNLLKNSGVDSCMIFIKSEGDIDTITPLYELGVQGIFTKSLDAALLNNRIDIAVHSLKDVPTQLAPGIKMAAVLKRNSYKDILVFKGELAIVNGELAKVNDSPLSVHHSPFTIHDSRFTVATSSIRRKAQWLHRYPNHTIENLRGNVNTRLQKLKENNWNGAIFAAAGLERIDLRPENSIDLDWMLPAPAQGAIAVVCRNEDDFCFDACHQFNDIDTELCTRIEREFLRALLGGCSTPISALAMREKDKIIFKGNICSVDGGKKIETEKSEKVENCDSLGTIAAHELLKKEEAKEIIYNIRNAGK